METLGRRLFVGGGDCGSDFLVFFFLGFCFRRLVEVVTVVGETSEQEFRFSKRI